MASLMSVRIVRSVEWATAQAIERGESVPRGLDFGTDPASLSKECRAAVLALDGRPEYPARLTGGYPPVTAAGVVWTLN